MKSFEARPCPVARVSMPLRPLPPRPCGRYIAGRRALDIAAVRKGDDHRVVGDEVFHGDFARFGEDQLPLRGVACFVADRRAARP